MKNFKIIRLANDSVGRTKAQIIRKSDGAQILRIPMQLSNVKRYLKDLNDNNDTGKWLIDRFNNDLK